MLFKELEMTLLDIINFHNQHLIQFCPSCRCPTLLAVWICLQCLFRKWHSDKTFPFLIIFIYSSQWPRGSLSGQLPFMLQKDNKNEIWRPHITLYQRWAARPRQTGHSPVKDGISVCWEDTNRAFIWVLIGWRFPLWKSHFFVISFSYLLKWKLSYNSDRFSSMFGSRPPLHLFFLHPFIPLTATFSVFMSACHSIVCIKVTC